MKRFLFYLFVIMVLVMPYSINAEEYAFEKFEGLFLQKSEIIPGERVYVDLKMKDITNDVKITLYISGNNKYLSFDLHDINIGNPYFEIPESFELGEYSISVLSVEDSSGSITYQPMEDISNGLNVHGYKATKDQRTFKVIKKEQIYFLNSVSIKGNNKVTKDDKLYLNLDVSKNVDFVTVSIKDLSGTGKGALLAIQDIHYNPYIDLSSAASQSYLIHGEYIISSIFLMPSSHNYSMYSIDTSENKDALQLADTLRFTIKEPDIGLDFFALKSKKSFPNSKVDMDINVDAELISASLTFKNNTDSFTVNINGLKSNPYIVIPLTANVGEYSLENIVLKSFDGRETVYDKSSGKNYFNENNIIIEKKEKTENNNNIIISEENLYLNNDELTPDIINQIKNLKSNISIEIDANNDRIIKKELFDAIKGTEKKLIIKNSIMEWVFNGIDIVNSKEINVNYNMNNIFEDSKLSKIISNGLVFDFSDNKELPGKCLIKILINSKISSVLNNNNINVYYYNEQTSKFDKVAMNVTLSNSKKYEFYIDHNSKYVLVNSEIDSKYISGKDTVLENNNNSGIINIVLISLIVLLIGLIITLIIKLKKNKQKNDLDIVANDNEIRNNISEN